MVNIYIIDKKPKKKFFKLWFRIKDGGNKTIDVCSNIKASKEDLKSLDKYGNPKPRFTTYSPELSQLIRETIFLLHYLYPECKSNKVKFNSKCVKDFTYEVFKARTLVKEYNELYKEFFRKRSQDEKYYDAYQKPFFPFNHKYVHLIKPAEDGNHSPFYEPYDCDLKHLHYDDRVGQLLVDLEAIGLWQIECGQSYEEIIEEAREKYPDFDSRYNAYFYSKDDSKKRKERSDKSHLPIAIRRNKNRLWPPVFSDK